MPLNGYTPVFESILDHPSISLYLGVAASELIELQLNGDKVTSVLLDGKPYTGLLIYTGAVDELLDWRFGLLPYRSLDFVYKRYDKKHVQPTGTVNFTVSEDYTRTTEYSWLTGQEIEKTTVAEEYPLAFTDPTTQIPYYVISGDENQAMYDKYTAMFNELPNFKLLGRLAEYRYYNMDQIVARALELADELLS
jgi:UDP-galactopyranose mutase